MKITNMNSFICANEKFSDDNNEPLFVITPVVGWVVVRYNISHFTGEHPIKKGHVYSMPVFSNESDESSDIDDQEEVLGVLPALPGVFGIHPNGIPGCDVAFIFNGGLIESYGCIYASLDRLFNDFKKKYDDMKKKAKSDDQEELKNE